MTEANKAAEVITTAGAEAEPTPLVFRNGVIATTDTFALAILHYLRKEKATWEDCARTLAAMGYVSNGKKELTGHLLTHSILGTFKVEKAGSDRVLIALSKALSFLSPEDRAKAEQIAQTRASEYLRHLKEHPEANTIQEETKDENGEKAEIVKSIVNGLPLLIKEQGTISLERKREVFGRRFGDMMGLTFYTRYAGKDTNGKPSMENESPIIIPVLKITSKTPEEDAIRAPLLAEAMAVAVEELRKTGKTFDAYPAGTPKERVRKVEIAIDTGKFERHSATRTWSAVQYTAEKFFLID